MTSIQTSSQDNTEGTPDLGSVFSLSIGKEVDVDPREFIERAASSIREVLNRRFPNDVNRQELVPKHDRLNFACPYCGDSHENSWAKRANVYSKGFNYHCFNCGQHTSFENFLKDFDKSIDQNDMLYLRDQHKKHEHVSLSSGTLDPYLFLQMEHVEKWAVDRTELIKKMGYTEARGTKIETYLKKRLQMDMNRFAWHQQAQKLLIFNLTQDGTKVIGFQIRNFVAKPKYLTFKLDKIYEEIFKREIPEDETFVYANSISITFGVMQLDINKPITVFEGPLDAYLFKNAVAVCSVKNDFLFDFPVRWMYDYDKSGKEASLKKINNGIPVFLWKKFLQESQCGINAVKKVDLTDILVYSIRKKINLPSFEGYFSKTKYDVYWV